MYGNIFGCHEISVVTPGEVSLPSSRWRAGMLLNTLQCKGQPPATQD